MLEQGLLALVKQGLKEVVHVDVKWHQINLLLCLLLYLFLRSNSGATDFQPKQTTGRARPRAVAGFAEFIFMDGCSGWPGHAVSL